MLQVRLHDSQRRQSIQPIAHLLRKHTRFERLVIYDHTTPEQRFIGAKPPDQLDRRTLSARRFECRSRKIRDGASQREWEGVSVSPEVFVNAEMPHLVFVTAEDPV